MLNDRNQIRQIFFSAWQKHKTQENCSALENQLVTLILEHPEYQMFFENVEGTQQENFPTDKNPFLHLSLHLSVREQIQTNRPPGIKKIFERLRAKSHDLHQLEHQIMDILATILWEAQQKGVQPCEKKYLENLQTLKQYI